MSTQAFNVWADSYPDARWKTGENIGSALVGCGMSKGSGGINWDNPASTGTETFSFTDSLQGTYPIVFTIEYIFNGSNNNGAPNTYRFTISAGANSITMPLFNSAGEYAEDFNNECNCFASGDGSRIGLALNEGPSIFSYYFMNIERSKDATGADTGDGVIIQCAFERASSSLGPTDPPTGLASLLLPFTGVVPGYQPTWNTAFNYNSATLNNATKIGTLQAVPFNFIPYNPGLGVLLYYGTDYPPYTPVSLDVYGAAHTYMPLQNVYSGFGTGGTDGASGPYGNPAMHYMMRWE